MTADEWQSADWQVGALRNDWKVLHLGCGVGDVYQNSKLKCSRLMTQPAHF